MRRFIVFAPAADVPKALGPLGEAVDIVTVLSLAEVEADGHPSVLILTAELVQDADLGSLPAHVTVLAKGPEARAAADGIDRLFLDMDDLTSQEAQLAAIRSAGPFWEPPIGATLSVGPWRRKTERSNWWTDLTR